ncbi:MAG: hypothetical protein A2W91_01245 [Bacteroidetes bacterium GWF2_38_335]|nr:MAG: hypothetical protein A2W91_01245 [Bacteroidetes bacterium GWF2_38_335]OFY80973.1 MAG: hypothetical protein A2281_13020 [Bacteroidetes bacterium RIFOXYA12_FULL_38_20]HBS85088.1 hypothetical protein [Bacteroidales bacterium]
MKTQLFILALSAIFLYNQGLSQNPSFSKSNQYKIITGISLSDEDLYILNQNNEMKNESVRLLNMANNTFIEVNQIKEIAFLSKNYNDLHSRALKKAEKLEYIAFTAQFESLEYIELANDLTYNLYKKLIDELIIENKSDNKRAAKELIIQSQDLYDKSKNMIEKAYENDTYSKSIASLFEAEKAEEKAIQIQEIAISLLIGFDYEIEPTWLANLDYSANLSEFNNNKLDQSLLTEFTIKEKAEIDFTYQDEEETINENLPEIKNTYKVQIGAFIGDIDEDAFFGINPITMENTVNGYTKIMVGDYNSVDVARHSLKILKETGYEDAFVVTYTEGIRVGMTYFIINDQLAKQ